MAHLSGRKVKAAAPAVAASSASAPAASPGKSPIKRALDTASAAYQAELVAAQQQQALRQHNKRVSKEEQQRAAQAAVAEAMQIKRAAEVAKAAGLEDPHSALSSEAGGDSGDDSKHGAQNEDDEASESASERDVARLVAKFEGQLKLMAAKISALEQDNARLDDQVRQTAEHVAMQAEGNEDAGEATEEQRAPATKGRDAAAARPVHFPKSAPGLPAPASSAPQQQVVQMMQIPLPARPAGLVYSAVEKTLETWCRQHRTWFRAARLQDEEDQLVQAVASMDAQLQDWWELQAGAKAARSFDALEAVLLATFIRKDAVERALTQLRDIRMLSSEDAHQYFLRVEELRVKARVTDEDRVVLATVFDRFDQARWPIAYAAASEAMRAGQIGTISALRVFLANKVLGEPKLNRPQVPQAQQNPPKSNRLSALESGTGTEPTAVEKTLADMARQLAALQARGPTTGVAVCARCKKSGHWHSECPEKDTRECYKCHKQGHVRRNCPEGAPARAAAAAVEPPKNE